MEKLLSIAKEVSIALIKGEETISVIESSSGGLISSSLLAQPGASAYYIGGQVVYTAKSIRGVTGLRLRDLKEKNIRLTNINLSNGVLSFTVEDQFKKVILDEFKDENSEINPYYPRFKSHQLDITEFENVILF